MTEQKNKRISAGLMMYRIKQESLKYFLFIPADRFQEQGYRCVERSQRASPMTAKMLCSVRHCGNLKRNRYKARKAQIISRSALSKRPRRENRACTWAFEGDMKEGFEPKSNTFKREWPPHSGKYMIFPEADRIEFFESETAKKRLRTGRFSRFMERLELV